MSKPNLGQSGLDPEGRRPQRIVHVRRPAGSRFVRWILVILLVLVALAVGALWQGAQSLQHVAQSTQQMSQQLNQGTQGIDRYLQEIGLALRQIGQALGQLLHALRT